MDISGHGEGFITEFSPRQKIITANGYLTSNNRKGLMDRYKILIIDY